MERVDAPVPVGELSARESCLTQGKLHLFLIFRTSTYWMRSTHIMEDHLLYTNSTDIVLNLIKNILTETPRKSD